MNVSVCLDQYASNYNVNNLSSNGFNIYTNIDNFTTPIAQGIPYQSLFSAPIGNCPYLLTNVPSGALQLLVIDSCTSNPTLPGSTTPTSQELLIDCCYALIDVPPAPISPEPPSFCNTCSLDFDVFSSSYVGQIVAGNLASNCGPITDYTIGWYKDGDYSSPEFISGYGNAFLPYQHQHPLTGSAAVPAAGGDWEGVIHDIAINGITYSSVSGSAGGQPIPFETCFGTIVVDPLTCNNGSVSPSVSKYSHQITFNSQAIGASPTPVSFTYNLSSTTKYFAYIFQGYSVWDELEIKFISGNPSATSNPSLYSQPIYLEKIRIGDDAPAAGIPPLSNLLPNPFPVPTDPNQTLNNVWPKIYRDPTFQRTLTLTTLQTSSNPLLPDYLEIKITPNPSNNNTQWRAGFQCLTNFDCSNCTWDNYPNNLPKINKIKLAKQYGCDAQRLQIFLTSSCPPTSLTSDWMGNPETNNGLWDPFNVPTSNLIGSISPAVPIPIEYVTFPEGNNYLALGPNIVCSQNSYQSPSCGSPSSGHITLTKTPNQIKLTFTLESDYLFYKNNLISEYNTLSTQGVSSPLTSPVSCPSGSTNMDYYRIFVLRVPIQGASTNCGDNTTEKEYKFHFNDYFNIVYVENPSSNLWSITIPQTLMVNCYPQTSGCDNCNSIAGNITNNYNNSVNSYPQFNFTTYVGAKYSDPFTSFRGIKQSTGGVSGSYCFGMSPSLLSWQRYPWYGSHTIPFISSSTGWVNLNSLKAFVPCVTSSFPNGAGSSTLGSTYYGVEFNYQVRFPHLTSSFNYTTSTNDFEIYALAAFGPTGSNYSTPNVTPAPCPDINSGGKLIYRYLGGVATMISSSHFWQGNTPTLIIDP